MGTAVRPAKTSPGPWDAFADVDVFVDAVLAELEAMAKDGTRPMRSGPKPPLTGAEPRKAEMAIWCVNFCGMQWPASPAAAMDASFRPAFAGRRSLTRVLARPRFRVRERVEWQRRGLSGRSHG
jgi:hypothetical protein